MDSKPYNRIRDVMIGLEIFLKHGGIDCCAEHDEFFAGPQEGTQFTDEELIQLEDAGWMSDDLENWRIFV